MIKDKEYYEALDKRTKEFKEWRALQDIEPHTTAELQEFTNEFITQAELNKKHEENPTIETVTGAGDIVERITEVTGIKKVVEFFTPEGKDCGCDKRKEAMNKTPILRHKVKVECLTVEEYNYMNPLLSNRQPISGKDAKRLLEIYQRIFNVNVVTSCNGCSMSKKLDELKAVLQTYK